MTDMQMVKELVNAMSEEEIETLAEYLQQRPTRSAQEGRASVEGAALSLPGLKLDLHDGAMKMREDFDDELPDAFWMGDDALPA